MTTHSFTHVLETQVDWDTRVNDINTRTTASRIRDFTRMNPPTFFGFKLKEDPQKFIYKMFKVLRV